MHDAGLAETVAAVIGLLLVAAVTAMALRRARLPYTVGLVAVGVGLGILADHAAWLGPLEDVALSPDLVLFVFLPTLIFESAVHLDGRLLARNLTPVLTLAAPGMLLAATIVALILVWTTPLGWGGALLFGALISATDPVAVVALFKTIGAPRRLAVLVEGESLFNDATAIVLFRVVLTVGAAGAVTAGAIGGAVLDFVVVFAGGLAVGLAIGWGMVRLTQLAEDDPLIEVALTTVAAYAAFIAADHYLRVSGVMATVGAGLVVGTLGPVRFTPAVRDYLERFWEYAGFVANSLIFLLMGLAVEPELLLAHAGAIGIAIIAVFISRAAVVGALVPLVNRVSPDRISRAYQAVLVWGGLRGAVALALVLSLAPGTPQRELLLALALGVVLFTLLVQATTIRPLLSRLGLDRPSLLEDVTAAQAALAAHRAARRRLEGEQTRDRLSPRIVERTLARWRDSESEAAARLAALEDRCDPNDVARVLWLEALGIERGVYRDLLDQAVLGEDVYRELALSVDDRADALRAGGMPDAILHSTPLEVRLAGWMVAALERVAPRSRWVRRHRLRALAAHYEHDWAVREAADRVPDALAALTHNAGHLHGALDEVRRTWARWGAEARAHMDAVAEHFPEYVAVVQSRAATRIGLDAEADTYADMAATGTLPPGTHQRLYERILAEERALKRQTSTIELSPEAILAGVPLLEGLNADALHALAGRLIPRPVLGGTEIIRQGTRGNALFLVGRGVVSVDIAGDGGSRRVCTLSAGDFFGEIALLEDAPRTATVTAVTDAHLYELRRPDVEQVAEADPAVRRQLADAARRRRAQLAAM